ncbi:MAG TPA: divalent-cation tolerance protein CutA [bacterium]|nr:divalent-cation tolerance protein CutA [bacterium]HPQ67256.1 divalent-cation tolerance protein CutA [bacterium]
MTTKQAALILTACATAEDAGRIAGSLVAERLAACVHVFAAGQSIYRWEGKTERTAERQVLVKTSPEKAQAAVVRIKELHPYQLPEILVLPAAGDRGYLDWIAAETEGE